MRLTVLTLLLVVACGTSSSPSSDAGPGAEAGPTPCPLRYCPEYADAGDAAVPDADLSCANPLTYFRDMDGDGYGDLGAPLQSCSQPAGYVTSYGDCNEADGRVHPGQMQFFTTPRTGNNFDYDCNGTSEVRSSATGTCGIISGSCVGGGTGGFWYGPAGPPSCGQEGTWLIACSAGCGVQSEVRKQGCR